MANGIKPNSFQSLSGGLTGSEEVYTQLNDLPRKFTVDDIKKYTVGDYSYTEQNTGRLWIDGSQVYEIVLDLGGKLNFNHKLNIKQYLDIRVISESYGTDYHLATISGSYAGTINGTATLNRFHISNLDANNINFQDVNFDGEITPFKYVILEYTKNT